MEKGKKVKQNTISFDLIHKKLNISGERNYDTAVDMWGVGCIMAEFWTRTPIMQGKTEQNQLFLISKLCGSITPDTWPGVQKLPLFNQIGKKKILVQNFTTKCCLHETKTYCIF